MAYLAAGDWRAWVGLVRLRRKIILHLLKIIFYFYYMAKNIIMSSHRITDCSQFGIVWLSSYCNTVEYLRVFCYKSEILAN